MTSGNGRDREVSRVCPDFIPLRECGSDGDTPAARTTVSLAWGENAFGQFGNGKTTDSDVPVTVKLRSGV